MENKNKKKIIRIENFGVREDVYNHIMHLRDVSGMTVKQLVTLIVNTCAKDIEFEFIEPKRIEVEREE